MKLGIGRGPTKKEQELARKNCILYKRIEEIDRIRKAYIFLDNDVICDLFHEYSELSGEFDWIFRIHWDTWDRLIAEGKIVDIAGIDDTMRKQFYIRRGFNPSFVTQRTVPEGRDDLFPLLEEIKLTYNDLFEVLCRTHGICGNDPYYVSRRPDEFVNVHQQIVPYSIPDFDTSDYGWLYGEEREKANEGIEYLLTI